MKHVIYVSCGDVSVYDSQIVALISHLQQIGVKVTLLQGYKSQAEKSILEKKLSSHGAIPTVWMNILSVYRIYESQNIKNLYNAIISIEGYQDAVFHVRNEYMGYLMKRLFQKHKLNLPLLIDIRGVIYEELLYKQSLQKGIRKLLSNIQRSYFKKCYEYLFSEDSMKIGITSVSSMINDYIKEHYPSCRYTMVVHPNISGSQFRYDESKRETIRQRYNIGENDILAICSSGGNAVWQKDYMVVKSMLDLGVKVLNLSKKDVGIEGCMTVSVPFSDMPGILSAADMAILWRDNTFINNSASPSKYSEFASMGLFVIHNRTVKVAEEHIMRSGAGILVDKVEDIHSLPSKQELSNQRENWIAQGIAFFGVESIVKSYLSTYDNLIKG